MEAFVPVTYASGSRSSCRASSIAAWAALRAAIANDPLVSDPASRSEPMVLGVAALRRGAVASAIEHLETALPAAQTHQKCIESRDRVFDSLGTSQGVSSTCAMPCA
jgi:hypothetical protein